jgi:glycosyltransferase involved in cell wall biosynthesis
VIGAAVFWASVAIVGYTYVLFPAVVAVRGLLRKRPYDAKDIEPRVSMIVAAYNEARTIEAKLRNTSDLDYPPDRLELVVASDGSTDGTDDIVSRWPGSRVRLVSLSRSGKPAALNAAVAAANGEILVFSDANSMYRKDALRALVRPFADPAVGGVAGNQRYVADAAHDSAAGERAYWNLDRRLKQLESLSGNTVSATGAIYAIRHDLFKPVPPGVMDDFVVSTGVIAQGRRLVFAEDAVANEPPAASSSHEFSRKVRNITLGLHAVLEMRELLNPWRHGFYAVQLFSHKVLRRLVVLPLIALGPSSVLLWSRGLAYRAATVAQLMLYGAATLGVVLRKTQIGRSKPFALPLYFCMVYAASLVAIANVVRGRRIQSWETARQSGDATVAAGGHVARVGDGENGVTDHAGS